MNIKYAAVPIIAMLLAGCNPAEVLEGRSSFRENTLRLAAITLPEPTKAPPAAVTVNLADTVAPPVSVALPVCFRVFRVNGCDASGNVIAWEPEP